MRIEFFFIFELESFLQIIDHHLAVDTSLARWQHGKSTVPLLLDLRLDLIRRLPLWDKVHSVILSSWFLRKVRVVDDCLLRALLFLLRWPDGLPAGLGFHRWIVYLRLLRCRIQRKQHLAHVGFSSELFPELAIGS